ncbi:MAG: SulP family inorganic anion transporter [bacterium]|nr:SulP family inorganic anion transporter [bacterium]
MSYFVPQLFLSMRSYSKEQLAKDVISGIIVAIIALPLSIALALASGVTPEQGLYTAIIAGFLISALGGSQVQIAGPTAAFASIVAGIVAKNGINGLVLATVMAGIFLIIMGVLKMGSLIRFIPFTITAGFTAGIAVTIIIGQIKDFLGLTFTNSPVETMEKLAAVCESFLTLNPMALLIGLLALFLLIVFPKINAVIPPSLVAVIVTSALVKLLNLKVNTIGDLYTISSALPSFTMPSISYASISAILPDAFTIAVLAAIESLLSCVVADSMIGAKHNSNMELIAQGVGNLGSALFGGIPATGAIARTAANIKNGGRSPIAGMVHALVLLLILVLLMPYAAWIPMPCIAAILFMVAYNMSGWRTIVQICRESPKSDIAVMALTLVLTVVFDLVLAIGVGMGLACLLFMSRMSSVTTVEEWEYLDKGENPKSSTNLMQVPDHIMVFELTGPLFFGAADKLANMQFSSDKTVLILRMRAVPAMDITALNTLRSLLSLCRKNGIRMILSHVNEQPMHVLEKSGFADFIGRENLAENIHEAIALAKRNRN